MPFDRITIGLSDRARNTYEVAFASGVDVGARGRGDVISLRGSIAERVVETKSTLLFQPLSLEQAERGFPASAPTFEAGLRSFLCAPLISNDSVIGLLHIQSAQAEAYSERDVTMIQSIAAQIAGAVSSSQLHAAVRNAEEATRQSEARFRDLFDAAPGWLSRAEPRRPRYQSQPDRARHAGVRRRRDAGPRALGLSG